jgi:8-oxo-dGTP pyrophosphatase MutT (NUDIX family)
VPGWLGERAAKVASGQSVPAVPRDAATVALLRSSGGTDSGGADSGGSDGFEVLLLGRGRAMDFAPGAHVFPGGSVDAADADVDIDWSAGSPGQSAAGQSAAEFAAALGGVPADRARALAGAAVRETFEECGVLLATVPAIASDVSAETSRAIAAAEDRQALLAGSVTLGEVLRGRGLVLRAEALVPWARWITPRASDRRYDTWFFVAGLPDGQVADTGIGAESDTAVWLRPAAALEAARAGEITLLPPTAVTLAELAACGTVEKALSQRRTLTPVLPAVVVEDDGQAWLALPEAVEYPL